MADKIQLRRDTAERWTTFNPILADGEIGLEYSTFNDRPRTRMKFGNGVQRWTDLPYASEADVRGILDDLIGSPSGIASLDASGKVPSDQLPDISKIKQIKVNGVSVEPDELGSVNITNLGSGTGTVKSISISGGDKIEPDSDGNINLENVGSGSIKGVAINGVLQPIGQKGEMSGSVDLEGVVKLNQLVSQSVDENSDAPVTSQAVAAELKQLKARMASGIRLNEEGNGSDKKYSITLLDSEGEPIDGATTDQFAAGGGGGSGTGEISLTRMKLVRISQNQLIRHREKVDLKLEYDHLLDGSSSGTYGKATITVTSGVNVRSFQQILTPGVQSTISLGGETDTANNYLFLGANTVRVRVEAGEGDDRRISTVSWTIQTVQLEITSNFDFSKSYRIGSNIPISGTLLGGGNKSLHCYVDGVKIDSLTKTGLTSSSSNFDFIVPTAGSIHGTKSIQLVAEVESDGRTIRSNSIYFGIMLVDPESTIPVVGTRFDFRDGDIIDGVERPYISANQFESYQIRYAIYSPGLVQSPVTIQVGDRILTSSIVQAGMQRIESRNYEEATLMGSIKSNSTTYSFEVRVLDTGIDLKEPTSTPSFKFDPIGRSNDDVNKAVWRSTVGDVTADLQGVNFGGDGWVDSSLALMDGGKAVINYEPLNQINQINARTQPNSFTFRTKIKISSVVDENVKLLSCWVDGSSPGRGTGFEITASKVKLMTQGGDTLEMSLSYDEIYDIAIVSYPSTEDSTGLVTFSEHERQNNSMIYLYINGIISGGIQRSQTDTMYQSQPTKITLGGLGATLSVYDIRFYQSTLNYNDIINLYILGMSTGNAIESKYKENDLLNDEGEVSIDKIPADLRYMIITGKASGTEEPIVTWLGNTTNKKDRFDVEEILHIKKSEPELNFRLEGGCIRLQGTSSLAYPIKNYRIYIKNRSKKAGKLYKGCDNSGNGGEIDSANPAKWSFKTSNSSDSGKVPIPVDCWCLKADYAESSSTHNTGMARLINNTLIKMNALTPPQKYVDQSYPYDVRTTVDGEPCLLFYRANKTDVPKFLGKFNLNNDKSTENVFGFKDIPGYHTLVGSSEPTSWIATKHGGKNPTECWEFLNNDYAMGRFLEDDFTAKEANEKGKQVAKWTRVWEARFPDNDDLNAAFEAGTKQPTHLERFVKWVKACGDAPESSKFRDELAQYMDVDYLCHYYNFTDIFGAVDQRVKNSMLAFFWKPEPTSTDSTAGRMLGYFIFYDNDTINGVRNDGKLKYKWDIDENTIDPETNKPAFMGHDSWLWVLLRKHFPDKLAESYKKIRSAMGNAVIHEMFDKRQSFKFAERIYNLDARNKYIVPHTIGTLQSNGSYKKESFLGSMQGSRTSHRHWWLNNRLSLFDSRFESGRFIEEGMRWKAASSPNATIKVTSHRSYYFSVKRENTTMKHSKVEANEEWTYSYPQEAQIGTIFYLYGKEFAKKIDMSGWDGLAYLSLPLFPMLEELNLSGLRSAPSELAISRNTPMLRKLNVSNWTSLPTLDLSHCRRLTELTARNCPMLGNITFASSAPIRVLNLPSNLTTLNLQNLPVLENSGITWDSSTIQVSKLIVHNCPKINWQDLMANLPRINRVRITGLNMRGDISILDKFFNKIKGVSANGIDTDYCALAGKFQLTTYLEDSVIAQYRAYFPELEIKQPEYSRYILYYHFEKDGRIEFVNTSENMYNDDNKSGFDPKKLIQDRPYIASGHFKTLFGHVENEGRIQSNGRTHRYLGKHSKQGVMSLIQLNDNDSTKYVDGTGAVLDGTQGDIWVKWPHFWYKVFNDMKKGCLYFCISSNEEKPTSSDNVKVISEPISGFSKSMIDVTKSSVLTSRVSHSLFNVAKFDLGTEKNKYIRHQVIPKPSVSGTNLENIGVLYTDERDQVVESRQFDPKILNPHGYVLDTIPENARYIYIPYFHILSPGVVVVGNSEIPEDYEPDWIEVKDQIISAMPTSTDRSGRLRSKVDLLGNTAIQIPDEPTTAQKVTSRAMTGMTKWHEDLFDWLYLLKYGKHRPSDTIGIGAAYSLYGHRGNYPIGRTISKGMRDTWKHGFYEENSFKETVLVVDNINTPIISVLGLENPRYKVRSSHFCNVRQLTIASLGATGGEEERRSQSEQTIGVIAVGYSDIGSKERPFLIHNQTNYNNIRNTLSHLGGNYILCLDSYSNQGRGNVYYNPIMEPRYLWVDNKTLFTCRSGVENSSTSVGISVKFHDGTVFSGNHYAHIGDWYYYPFLNTPNYSQNSYRGSDFWGIHSKPGIQWDHWHEVRCDPRLVWPSDRQFEIITSKSEFENLTMLES